MGDQAGQSSSPGRALDHPAQSLSPGGVLDQAGRLSSSGGMGNQQALSSSSGGSRDQPRQSSSPGGALDQAAQSLSPGGALDQAAQSLSPGGVLDQAGRSSSSGGIGAQQAQPSSPGGTLDQPAQSLSPGGVLDQAGRLSSSGGMGNQQALSSSSGGSRDQPRQSSSPGGALDQAAQSLSPGGALDQAAQSLSPGGVLDQAGRSSSSGGIGAQQAQPSSPGGTLDQPAQSLSPGGVLDQAGRSSSSGGIGAQQAQSLSPGRALDQAAQSLSPGGVLDQAGRSSSSGGIGAQQAQSLSPGRALDQPAQSSSSGGVLDQAGRSSSTGGSRDQPRQLSSPGGALDQPAQSLSPGGILDQAGRLSSSGGMGAQQAQSSSPGGALDQPAQSSSPGGALDRLGQSSSSGGIGAQQAQSSSSDGSRDQTDQSSSPGGALDQPGQSSSSGGIGTQQAQSSSSGGVLDQAVQSASSVGIWGQTGLSSFAGGMWNQAGQPSFFGIPGGNIAPAYPFLAEAFNNFMQNVVPGYPLWNFPPVQALPTPTSNDEDSDEVEPKKMGFDVFCLLGDERPNSSSTPRPVFPTPPNNSPPLNQQNKKRRCDNLETQTGQNGNVPVDTAGLPKTNEEKQATTPKRELLPDSPKSLSSQDSDTVTVNPIFSVNHILGLQEPSKFVASKPSSSSSGHRSLPKKRSKDEMSPTIRKPSADGITTPSGKQENLKKSEAITEEKQEAAESIQEITERPPLDTETEKAPESHVSNDAALQETNKIVTVDEFPGNQVASSDNKDAAGLLPDQRQSVGNNEAVKIYETVQQMGISLPTTYMPAKEKDDGMEYLLEELLEPDPPVQKVELDKSTAYSEECQPLQQQEQDGSSLALMTSSNETPAAAMSNAAEKGVDEKTEEPAVSEQEQATADGMSLPVGVSSVEELDVGSTVSSVPERSLSAQEEQLVKEIITSQEAAVNSEEKQTLPEQPAVEQAELVGNEEMTGPSTSESKEEVAVDQAPEKTIEAVEESSAMSAGSSSSRVEENNKHDLSGDVSTDEDEPGEATDRWLRVVSFDNLTPGLVMPLNELFERMTKEDQERKKAAKRKARGLVSSKDLALPKSEDHQSGAAQKPKETVVSSASSQRPEPSSCLKEESALGSQKAAGTSNDNADAEQKHLAAQVTRPARVSRTDVLDSDRIVEMALAQARSEAAALTSGKRKRKTSIPSSQPTPAARRSNRISAQISNYAARLEEEEKAAAIAAVDALTESDKSSSKKRGSGRGKVEPIASTSTVTKKRGRPPVQRVEAGKDEDMAFSTKQVGRTLHTPDFYARRVGQETSNEILRGVRNPTKAQDCVILDHFRSPVVRRAIRNQRVMCYAISVLQLMMRVPQIYSMTKTHHHETNAPDNNGCFICLLAQLISTKPQRDQDYQIVEDMLLATWDQIKLEEMQCAMDVMQKFFTRFDRDFMKLSPEYEGIQETQHSPIRSFFQIEIINTFQCVSCPFSYQLSDTAIYISIDVRRECKTMQSYIDETSKQDMDSTCETCGSKAFYCKQTFRKLPSVLFYYVPRVLVLGSAKNSTVVPIQKELNLKDDDGHHKYKLCAFITHTGDTSENGHYKCFEVDRSGPEMLNEYNDGYVAINSTLCPGAHLVLAMYRKPEDIAKDQPTDIIFDGRGNVIYARDKYCGPQKFPLTF